MPRVACLVRHPTRMELAADDGFNGLDGLACQGDGEFVEGVVDLSGDACRLLGGEDASVGRSLRCG